MIRAVRAVGRWIAIGYVCQISGLAFAEEVRPDVIYGDDDRLDFFQESDSAILALASSTAVLVDKSKVTIDSEDPGQSQLPQATFGEGFGLCEDEPFFQQPNPGFCSGFLVGEDIFVTAGHCIDSAASCESVAFVFGFSYLSEDHDPSKVKSEDVYFCQRIIARELEGGLGSDYAVIKLDRKVTGREPLKFRSEGKVEDGAGLVVIGHPSGLPTKVAAGAYVRDNSNDPYLVANLDTYGGNSGSAVFNLESHEVEGILVRGETDFITRGDCRISNQCADDACRGEDVTRATEFAPHVPDPNQPEIPTRDVILEQDDLALEIPDNNPEGAEFTLDVSEAEEIVHISLHLKIDHSYVGDLVLKLIHPNGAEATVLSREGGNDLGIDEVFGYEGRFVGDFMNFRGLSSAGQWRLKVIDGAAQDLGQLNYVKLTLKVKTEL